MVRTIRAFALFVVAAAAPAAAQAQVVAPGAAGTDVKPVGEYSGVPDVQSGAGPKVAVRRGKFPQLLWVGFKPREEGGARLFLQLDRELTPSQAVVGGKLVVSLDDARVTAKNTLRWLDTRFFGSGVARVEGKRVPRRKGRRAGIDIIVTFKDKVAPIEGAIASAQGKDGLTYVTLDFPPE